MNSNIDDIQLVTSDDWRTCSQMLFREAGLLDDRRHGEWLTLLDDEVDYRILNRITREKGGDLPAFDPSSYHLRCNRGALTARIERVQTGWAFAEDPPATTRRFISNIQPQRVSPDEIHVASYLLLFRARWDEQAFISARREDVWREFSPGRILLSRRFIYLDQTSLPVDNLSVVL